MVGFFCTHEELKKHGHDRNGNQRYRCCKCGMTRVDVLPKVLGDMRLPTDKAVMVLKLLLEGTSIRSIERLTGVNRNTIMDLLVLIGRRCERFWRAKMQNITAHDVEVDELWGYVGMKEKTRKRLNIDSDYVGDIWCFVAIERTTKLVMAYFHGKRTPDHTQYFVRRLGMTLEGSPQITTDGYAPYANLIPHFMKDRGIGFAQLIKIFGTTPNKGEGKYSPAPIAAIKKDYVMGFARQDRVCTSHIERQNLSIRMGVRRMTRLTNAFSKKWDNHTAAIALWFVWYNFGRKHMTLKATPAQAHGLADHAWTVEELLDELTEFA